MIKKRIVQAVLISVFATLGLAKFAAAANVQVDPTAKVNICYNYNNVYQSYQFPVWDLNLSITDSGLAHSGWPATNNTSITYVSGTHTYSNCYDYYFNSSQSATQLYFTDTSPRTAVVDIFDIANSHASDWTNTATHYYATFELRNTTDNNGNITGQEAVLLYIKNASGTKVNQLDFNYTAGVTPMDIRLKKTVKGSTGDTTKYFTFTVNIAGSTGATYTVNGTTGTGSASACTANTNCVIYLKHGDDIRIGYDGTSSEIPAGTTYTITESDNTGYTVTNTVGSAAATSGSATGTKTVSATAANNVVTFTNTKDGSPATGLFTNIWPYLAIAAISGAGIFLAKKRFVKIQK